MWPRPCKGVVPAACVAAGLCVAALTGPPAGQGHADVADAHAHAVEPITYFNARCASCHGDYGTFWGGAFAGDTPHGDLRGVVAEMAAGPAMEPLAGLALEVQTAYNFSLSDAGRVRGPFVVAVTSADGLRGEATPASRLGIATSDGVTHDVPLVGHTFTFDGADITSVSATRDDVTTRLTLPAQPDVPGDAGTAVTWSHHR